MFSWLLGTADVIGKEFQFSWQIRHGMPFAWCGNQLLSLAPKPQTIPNAMSFCKSGGEDDFTKGDFLMKNHEVFYVFSSSSFGVFSPLEEVLWTTHTRRVCLCDAVPHTWPTGGGKDSDGHFASTPLQIHVTDTSDWADSDISLGVCLVLRSVCIFSEN